MRYSIYIFILLGICQAIPNYAEAQDLSNLRVRTIVVEADTIQLDSLSIIPNTCKLFDQSGNAIDELLYRLIETKGILIWKKEQEGFDKIKEKSLTISYRVFPFLFTEKYQNKDPGRIEKEFEGNYNPFKYYGKRAETGIFKMKSLNKSGSISRGLSFGNNQDVVVNSSLNLQLSGKLSDDVEILAAITDNNIPFQPEGNTQQIQDFDKVFIQLSKNRTKLVAGDFDLKRPDSYFMNFFKKGQGGLISTVVPVKNNAGKELFEWHTQLSASVSRGRYSRNNFFGQEGNQGPYRLTGANNETFITILSGSEKVYIDGKRMVRGQDNDYIIDYNTSEITFTANRIITKDKRVVVEFQYSDRNYGRSLVHLNNEFWFDKAKVKVNLYSEQDSKNQSLLQDLDDDAKRTLAMVGDSLELAVIPNIDSVAFNGEEVLYREVDTLVNAITYRAYVFSTDPAKAFYRLGFTNLGNNNGNYIQIQSSANGRVFEWIAPVNGLPQGSYEPVQQLIAPKKRQMATLGVDYNFSEKTNLSLETAYSNYDKNLFSSKDKNDDGDYAVHLKFGHRDSLKFLGSGNWEYFTGIEFDHINKNFTQLEPFRNIEFTRDWNLSGTTTDQTDDAVLFKLGLRNDEGDLAEYRFRSFFRGDQYDGIMNQIKAAFSPGTWRVKGDASYLLSNSLESNSDYLREKVGLEKEIGPLRVGVTQEGELNEIVQKSNDTLAQNSFAFNQLKAYLNNGDTSSTFFQAEYRRRYDYTPNNNELKEASIADEASVGVRLQKNPNSKLNVNALYRELQIIDERVLNTSLSDNTALGRIEYFFRTFKGVLQSNSFYQIGTGQEQRKEFTYVEVPTGQGVYTWTDYNDNDIQELNEFEVANFTDQANYVRVFTPTNDFIRTRSNQFNTVFNITPAANRSSAAKKTFIKRFNDQLAIRLDNKSVKDDLLEALNPFFRDAKDSALITSNTSFRNTLFFNRTSPVFGLDYTLQEVRNKSELVNGFEIRVRRSMILNSRVNASKVITINTKAELGNNENISEFFSTRDYDIEYYSIFPKLSFQKGKNFRVSLSYELRDQQNNSGDVGEVSTQNDFGVELKYSSVKQGIITARFNYIDIDYNSTVNSPIAYEMLQGLNVGKNLKWNVSVLKNLSKVMQVNLNYDGRDTGADNIIHTGSVQVRAFF